MTAPKEKLLWSLPDVADAVGMDVRTLRKAVEEGSIPSTRVGRNIKIPLWWIKLQRDGTPQAA